MPDRRQSKGSVQTGPSGRIREDPRCVVHGGGNEQRTGEETGGRRCSGVGIVVTELLAANVAASRPMSVHY